MSHLMIPSSGWLLVIGVECDQILVDNRFVHQFS